MLVRKRTVEAWRERRLLLEKRVAEQKAELLRVRGELDHMRQQWLAARDTAELAGTKYEAVQRNLVDMQERVRTERAVADQARSEIEHLRAQNDKLLEKLAGAIPRDPAQALLEQYDHSKDNMERAAERMRVAEVPANEFMEKFEAWQKQVSLGSRIVDGDEAENLQGVRWLNIQLPEEDEK